jgi:hypothetical protein
MKIGHLAGFSPKMQVFEQKSANKTPTGFEAVPHR